MICECCGREHNFYKRIDKRFKYSNDPSYFNNMTKDHYSLLAQLVSNEFFNSTLCNYCLMATNRKLQGLREISQKGIELVATDLMVSVLKLLKDKQ